MARPADLTLLTTRMPTGIRDEFTSYLASFLRNEYDIDLGTFDAEEILTFFGEKIGPYYYNEGLNAARSVVVNGMNDLADDIGGLEVRI